MSEFEKLEKQVLALAARTVIMPIDEIRLASALGSLKDLPKKVPSLVAWGRHENLHVRRVAINALVRGAQLEAAGVKALLVERLSESEGRTTRANES